MYVESLKWLKDDTDGETTYTTATCSLYLFIKDTTLHSVTCFSPSRLLYGLHRIDPITSFYSFPIASGERTIFRYASTTLFGRSEERTSLSLLNCLAFKSPFLGTNCSTVVYRLRPTVIMRCNIPDCFLNGTLSCTFSNGGQVFPCALDFFYLFIPGFRSR